MDAMLGLLADASPTLGRLAAAAAAGRWRQWLAAGAGAALAAFLAVETSKAWPLSYPVRLFALLLRCRFFPRPLIALDVPIVARGRVRLSDLDFHGHVNNAQYALDADLMGVRFEAALLARAQPGVF